MSQETMAKLRAREVARIYIAETEQLGADELIAEMEKTAYALVRDGDSRAANILFLAVAELELVRLKSSDP